MNTAIRLKLEMAARTRTWVRAHPEPTELYTSGLARLEDLLTRAEELALKQRNGRGIVRESVEQRAQLRRSIRQEPLRHLARIATAAAANQPGVAQRFRLPSTGISHKAFLIAARDMASEAVSHRELFQRYGMADDFLGNLTASLDEYDRALQAADTGHSAHVGASADLEAVTGELMALIRDFDAMYQYRFRAEPEQLAAWASARNVAWHVATPPAEPDIQPPIAPAA